MSANTIHSQLCLLASLKEQWREKRKLTLGQEAVLTWHDGYLHERQIEEVGRETTKCSTHREATSVPGNDRVEPQNE